MRLVRHSRAIVDSLSRGAQRLGSSTAQRLRSGRKSEIEPRPLSPRRTVQWVPPQRVERRGARASSSAARKPLIPRGLAQAGYGSGAIIGVLIVAHRDFESFNELPQSLGEPLDCSFRCAFCVYRDFCCPVDPCCVLDRGTVAESSFRGGQWSGKAL